MVSPPERPRSGRRRIAGERSRRQDAPADPAVDETPATTDGQTTAEQAPDEQAAHQAVGADPGDTITERTPLRPRRSKPRPAKPTSGPPNWVLAVLAGLLVVALALDGLVVWRELDQRQEAEASARALHSALIRAPAVAERAAEALLSYRHDTLDKDVAEARKFASKSYRSDYISTIRDLVAAPAGDVQATVKAKVLATGVVEASGQRSDVLLFVNQTTTSSTDAEPKTALNRVVFTMVREDGQWVVDEVRAL